ncbi:MAG: hypothetical protein ABIW82_04790, partial [Dokdonella sp.]
MTPLQGKPAYPPRSIGPELPVAGACATPMAIVGRELDLRATNLALLEWLAAGARNWSGERLAVLDAKPPQVCDAVERAFVEDRRIWLREARLRTAIGDRGADLALTPLDAQTLLIEVLPLRGDAVASTRLSESLRGFAHEVRGPLAGMRGAAQLLQRRVDAPELVE